MKNIRKKILLILIVSMLAAANLYGCTFPSVSSPLENKESASFFALDTFIQLTIYDRQDESEASPDTKTLLADAEKLVTDYEALFSATMPDSDIYRINHASGEWVTVSDETVLLLDKALQYCEASGGALDITILPVKELWDFTGKNPAVPSMEALQNALSHVDYTTVELDGKNVRLKDPKAMLDLGCIAKGFIADRLYEFLTDHGVTSALLSLGGNVVTIGAKPDGSPFTIGIQKPFDETGAVITTLSCPGREGEYNSVVTSGIYERCFTKNGKLYHHIIDADTGFPAENNIASVTILSSSSTEGDALSTLCLLLGTEESEKLLSSLHGVEAIFVTREEEVIHIPARSYYSDSKKAE